MVSPLRIVSFSLVFLMPSPRLPGLVGDRGLPLPFPRSPIHTGKEHNFLVPSHKMSQMRRDAAERHSWSHFRNAESKCEIKCDGMRQLWIDLLIPNGNPRCCPQLSGIHKSPHKRFDPSSVTDYENLVGCVSSGKVPQILKNGSVPPFDRPTRKQLRLLDGRIFWLHRGWIFWQRCGWQQGLSL